MVTCGKSLNGRKEGGTREEGAYAANQIEITHTAHFCTYVYLTFWQRKLTGCEKSISVKILNVRKIG